MLPRLDARAARSQRLSPHGASVITPRTGICDSSASQSTTASVGVKWELRHRLTAATRAAAQNDASKGRRSEHRTGVLCREREPRCADLYAAADSSGSRSVRALCALPLGPDRQVWRAVVGCATRPRRLTFGALEVLGGCAESRGPAPPYVLGSRGRCGAPRRHPRRWPVHARQQPRFARSDRR